MSIHRRPFNASHQAIPRHREVVERVERYVRERENGPVSIHCLCREVGCSERGLRNAFYDVHGIGPKRWMITERLIRAQKALSASLGDTTVTTVATDLGFYQLGRFAAIYRERFGEMPSGTLRAANPFSDTRSSAEGKRRHAFSR